MRAQRAWPLRANDRRHRKDPERNERYTAFDLVATGARLGGVARFDLDVAARPASNLDTLVPELEVATHEGELAVLGLSAIPEEDVPEVA